jgi:alkanesulfonate monooxygenase SsuD/methylene tetrahydromethanopterin reductase-like flavin-dependent oxidoreductase (luciferase family)
MLAAKMLATLDVLSKGRMTVGVGIGWMAEEIALLGGPEFRHRAAASDETIQAFRALWTSDKPSFYGEHVRFENLLFAPKPLQKNGMPVWVGGEVKGALRRAGKFADAWYPVAANPRIPLDTPDLYHAALREVRAEAEKAGRDPMDVEAALLAIKCRIGPEQEGRDGKRMAFTGSAQAIVDDIGEMAGAGLQHFLIGGDGDDLPGTLERLEEFAKDVMAKVG